MSMLALVEDRMPRNSSPHIPVLLEPLIELFTSLPAGTFIDGTVGAGGHALAFLSRTSEAHYCVGIDRDPDALVLATKNLADYSTRFTPVHGRHEDLNSILDELELQKVQGVWLDLGVSSMQLDQADRGFSFRQDAPLDMRMDRTQGITAAEWLAEVEPQTLRKVLHKWGEEPRAKTIAHEICRVRERSAIKTTRQLAELVERVATPRGPRPRIHVATKTFQAIRIHLNQEISGLEQTLEDAVKRTHPGGVVAVISFHSLEDRVVKHTFRTFADRCTCPASLPVCGCGRKNWVRILTGKAITASEDEISQNPRARSAKLRAVEVLP